MNDLNIMGSRGAVRIRKEQISAVRALAAALGIEERLRKNRLIDGGFGSSAGVRTFGAGEDFGIEFSCLGLLVVTLCKVHDILRESKYSLFYPRQF